MLILHKPYKEDAMYEELRRRGYKSMSEMNGQELLLLAKIVALIERVFGIHLTANDVSIKEIKCKKCGGIRYCIHYHSMISGVKHPDLDVHVDDIIEICTKCGDKEKYIDPDGGVYETNPELRIKNCPYCDRDILNDGNLKVFNRTSC